MVTEKKSHTAQQLHSKITTLAELAERTTSRLLDALDKVEALNSKVDSATPLDACDELERARLNRVKRCLGEVEWTIQHALEVHCERVIVAITNRRNQLHNAIVDATAILHSQCDNRGCSAKEDINIDTRKVVRIPSAMREVNGRMACGESDGPTAKVIMRLDSQLFHDMTTEDPAQAK